MTEPFSFYWHDYETSGTDARRDRPVQFAGQRTTLDLEPAGDPTSIFCHPAPDVLPGSPAFVPQPNDPNSTVPTTMRPALVFKLDKSSSEKGEGSGVCPTPRFGQFRKSENRDEPDCATMVSWHVRQCSWSLLPPSPAGQKRAIRRPAPQVRAQGEQVPRVSAAQAVLPAAPW